MGDAYKRHLLPLCRRQQWHCYYCNEQVSREVNPGHPNRATLDHRIPRSLGGSDQRINLVVACNSCNGRKGQMTAVQFMNLCFEEGSKSEDTHLDARDDEGAKRLASSRR